MLVGIPGSGKTTLAQSLLKEAKEKGEDLIWLSSDEIREELFGSASEQKNPSLVFNTMAKRTYEALGKKKSVIYDATNLNSKRRRGFLSTLGKYSCKKECLIMATPYEECLKRNEGRDREVPFYAMERMYKSFQMPYMSEGRDAIGLVYTDGGKGSFGSPKAFADSLMEYCQDNPHHRESLGDHLKGVAGYLIDQGYTTKDTNLYVAGLLHDCGKPYTKGFFNSKGLPSDIAHYYSHESVGAYDSLFFDYGEKTEADVLEIAAIISNHMYPFQWDKSSTFEKQKHLLGPHLYDQVMKLHEADEASSIGE